MPLSREIIYFSYVINRPKIESKKKLCDYCILSWKYPDLRKSILKMIMEKEKERKRNQVALLIINEAFVWKKKPQNELHFFRVERGLHF